MKAASDREVNEFVVAPVGGVIAALLCTLIGGCV
jgi:hypothetical protein